MKFVGYDGEIEIGDGVIIIKKGKKDLGRTISFSNIVLVTLIKPVFTAAGCIHIQVIGARTYPSVANVTHYGTDMNAICFRKPKYEEAIKFKETLEKAMAESRKSDKVPSGNGIDTEALMQLKQLLDVGAITQEDYDRKKNQILGM